MAQEFAYVSIHHESNLDNIYKLPTKSIQNFIDIEQLTTEKNIIKISIGSEIALVFIIKYLEILLYSDEIPAPEHPLANDMELVDIFEFELPIFGNLLKIDEENEENIKKTIFMKNVIELASYFKMQTLVKKMASIMAFYMQNISQI